jgi:hypothetical protein
MASHLPDSGLACPDVENPNDFVTTAGRNSGAITAYGNTGNDICVARSRQLVHNCRDGWQRHIVQTNCVGCVSHHPCAIVVDGDTDNLATVCFISQLVFSKRLSTAHIPQTNGTVCTARRGELSSAIDVYT